MTLQVPSFQSARVLVAGDVMLDRYWFGPTDRVSPEAPVPVVQIKEIEERAGGAANVAVNLASLGTKTRLLGVVGNDDAGESLESLLTSLNIECRFSRPCRGGSDLTPPALFPPERHYAGRWRRRALLR